MNDAMQSKNEAIGVDAPAPGNLLAGQRTWCRSSESGWVTSLRRPLPPRADPGVRFSLVCLASLSDTNNLVNVVQQNAVTAYHCAWHDLCDYHCRHRFVGGSTAAMTGVLGVELVARGWHWPPAMLIAVLAGGAIGLGNGLLISFAKLNPFIATLA